MRYTQETGTIRFIAEIAPGIYNCLVHAPKIAAAASVGPVCQRALRRL